MSISSQFILFSYDLLIFEPCNKSEKLNLKVPTLRFCTDYNISDTDISFVLFNLFYYLCILGDSM